MHGRLTMKRKKGGSERPIRHTISKARKCVWCGVCKQKGHYKTTFPQVEMPPKTIGRKPESVRQTQELVNMQRGGEDVAMGDADQEDVEMADVGGQDKEVNDQEVYFAKVEQPRMRKKSERILKLKVGKNIEGEGSSASKLMDLE
ncbi:unnamed protein product [Lactuca saligna]|uniref:Uncharacterized protein n=1 Tax=Lactuca saligna TaxID=75948 RepID=A0AA36ENJ9_LACSI|nr:unnamed protein product [Lactuca saligna]